MKIKDVARKPGQPWPANFMVIPQAKSITVHSKCFKCPVCGYPNLSEPPYDDYGCSTFSICPCCGTEFGYDDSGKSYTELRRIWICNGMSWWGKSTLPPDNWDPEIQLKGLRE